jgi:glycerophosphoryl diester phosphodiesterase
MKTKLISIFFFLLHLLISEAQVLPEKGVCAHRGASFSHPENTLAAINEAIRLGVQMIEFDVRSTRDSMLVIIHDTDLKKTTGINSKVNEITFEELRKLDAGLWKGDRFKGEKIPTLEELLNIIPSNIWMNIHIKDEKETAINTVKVLKNRNKLSNALLAVDGQVVDEIRMIDSTIKICCMDRKDSPKAYIEEAIKINANFIQLTEREFPFLGEIIPVLKSHNIKINFYFTDEIIKAKHLFNSGVDFVLVNNIEKILPIVQN